MTIRIGWLGVDERSPCSAYLMSDSRFTWGTNPESYNYGQKLFALNNSPDILGYCGEVLFASQVLTQIVGLDNTHVLFPTNSDSQTRSRIIFNQIVTQFAGYPQFARSASTIYHISRDLDSSFHTYRYSYSHSSNSWETSELPLHPSSSSLIFSAGSGREEFIDRYSVYQHGSIAGTSRNIFQCFCDSLMNSELSSCGGSPQLVGLYRGKGFNGMPFGIIYNHTRYLLGVPSPVMNDYNSIRWYNENFEICDGNSLTRFPNAMRQPNPNIQ